MCLKFYIFREIITRRFPGRKAWCRWGGWRERPERESSRSYSPKFVFTFDFFQKYYQSDFRPQAARSSFHFSHFLCIRKTDCCANRSFSKEIGVLYAMRYKKVRSFFLFSLVINNWRENSLALLLLSVVQRMLANSDDNGASRKGKKEAGDEQLRKQSGDKTEERPLSGSSRKADYLQQFEKNIPEKNYNFPPDFLYALFNT